MYISYSTQLRTCLYVLPKRVKPHSIASTLTFEPLISIKAVESAFVTSRLSFYTPTAFGMSA